MLGDLNSVLDHLFFIMSVAMKLQKSTLWSMWVSNGMSLQKKMVLKHAV